ncbi:PorP/SprF family type IX secretion system membrane protein [Capnocytophaga cynodegmi]|uniref:PorP/SprF family type IX secretion system membrane protein n=1 Tax=Capnocytophaga cynodegmi TaxID=28189 RepID=UPI003570BF9D
MRKSNAFLMLMLLLCTGVFAQQESQYTQYMYNTMMFNPGYAGSRDVGSFFGLYRTQWVGLEGAPKTATLSYHTPIRDKNVGLGVSLFHESIGPQQDNTFLVDFSYTLNFENSKLAFGLKGSAGFFQLDVNKLHLYDGQDYSFTGDNSIFRPNVGAGLFWYSDKYYVGFSVPNLLETEVFRRNDQNREVSVLKNSQHYYLIGGYVFDLTENTKFKPAVLSKVSYGAPFQLDVSANFMFNEKFVLGAAWRWSAAVSAMAGFQINDRWFIGYGYDFETTELSRYNSGSHEIFLRYELVKAHRKVVSPRFF